ncbi:hypothetical protein Psi01_50330 [Planobispora siamensis]|uniref:Uncharacterized protein n=1 Tax=Planobispora siamensis TaxID=936338 RepID=A0A8J3SHG5_9ACTN|nr:hypothetical protein Psi01_50330 [Planobispora siamensis]
MHGRVLPGPDRAAVARDLLHLEKLSGAGELGLDLVMSDSHAFYSPGVEGPETSRYRPVGTCNRAEISRNITLYDHARLCAPPCRPPPPSPGKHSPLRYILVCMKIPAHA